MIKEEAGVEITISTQLIPPPAAADLVFTYVSDYFIREDMEMNIQQTPVPVVGQNQANQIAGVTYRGNVDHNTASLWELGWVRGR